MNRYVATGLVDEMQAGKRVLFVAENQGVAREALRQTREAVNDLDLGEGQEFKVILSRGAERIESPSGGWIRFVNQQGKSHRGLKADLVVFHDVNYDNWGDYVAMRPDELIRL